MPWPFRKPARVSPADQVGLAYRAVLRREPDPDGLAQYAKALREGRNLAWLVEQLAGSDEFRNAAPAKAGPTFPLDEAPPMPVQASVSPAALQALWDKVASVWSTLGEQDPHWSVLTEDRFRARKMDAAALAAFHETGQGEVRRLNAWLRRAGIAPPHAVCAEYGCGVGRITRSLALQFDRVLAFDVSASHLRQAASQMAADGITNVTFHQVGGATDLAALAGIDLFYSVISLQHSPPPIILDVLQHAFAGLRPGGCAFFQLPTYGTGYAFPQADGAQDGMEMHFVPQQAVFAAAYEAGLKVIEVQPDWCTGRPGEWISNTFLLQKPY